MLKFFRKKTPAANAAAQSEPVEDAAGESLADAAVAAPAEPATDPDNQGRGWRSRLAGSVLARGMGGLFERNPRLDDELLDELETILISSDVGIETSTVVCEALRARMHKREFADARALRQALRDVLLERLQPVQQPLEISDAAPFVLMVVGINGVGKTTTIGKLARHARDEGLSVMLAAGDTFRAAAVEQLQVWGERNQVPVVAQGQGSDSASVIFDAVQSARARQIDLLIADTAGRLHTQAGLMDELGKIARVVRKLDADAPHEVLMVIDGGTGQNAINQVRQFREMVNVTGLVVTKLDGTAKGGVIFALAEEFGLPIRFVGLGEGINDLRVFDAERFVAGLLPE
ncbi:MAG: signal recognition particle-docking protein FtsY [Rhodanobacteraceae bacterium]